jgi:transglutaminase/protease-like cytokinesis protein 3
LHITKYEFSVSLTRNCATSTIYKGHLNTSLPKPIRHNNFINNKLAQLAHKITKHKVTDKQKAEAIYLWITKNIEYDYELRFNKKLQKDFYTSKDKVIQKVLQRQKALCGGYAFLFDALCREVGIKSKAIHGFTKLTTNYDTPNHTWNAIKLNGNWHLIDITWSISNATDDMPDMYWYLTNPNDFIKSHYPENPDWSLLNNPPSLLAFTS